MTSAGSELRSVANKRSGALAKEEPVPMPGGIVSFFGKAARGGDWLVPAHFRVVAVVGVVRLDLRRARFSSPTTTIEAAVLAGRLEIGLPGGYRVEYAGSTFGGSFEYHPRSPNVDSVVNDRDVQLPIIRVIGTHVAGAIDVYEDPSWDSIARRLRRAAAAFRD
jgi:hypothetical protein